MLSGELGLSLVQILAANLITVANPTIFFDQYIEVENSTPLSPQPNKKQYC